MKINSLYLPVKCHYFFFMAAMGPVLPFLPVYAKDLGMSEVAMGTLNGILPIICLLAKPIFGFILDFFSSRRKIIFILVIVVTVASFASITFIPNHGSQFQHFPLDAFTHCLHDAVNPITCNYACPSGNHSGQIIVDLSVNCSLSEVHSIALQSESCDIACEVNSRGLYSSISFWALAILSGIFMVGYNVSNSLSDAICFDVLGDGNEQKYGRQRVFGTIGFGISSLLGAAAVNFYSVDQKGLKKYLPAFVLSAACCLFDLLTCVWKLKIPKLPQSDNIVGDVAKLCKVPQILTFLVFATCVGMCDSSFFYFLLWYLNDLGTIKGTANMKLLEGVVIAVETLCGELVCFTMAGKIIKKLGYTNTFTLCFFIYSLRFVLVASIDDPWWAVPIEMVFQGPTYALLYSTVVVYASAISPPGTSATTQGIVAGMDDGLGFALGNVISGVIYNQYGGHVMFYFYSFFALFCGIIHFSLHRFVFSSALEDHVESPSKSEQFSLPEGHELLKKEEQLAT